MVRLLLCDRPMNERPTKSLKRRDGAGHLDPASAEKLREISEQIVDVIIERPNSNGS